MNELNKLQEYLKLSTQELSFVADASRKAVSNWLRGLNVEGSVKYRALISTLEEMKNLQDKNGGKGRWVFKPYFIAEKEIGGI